MPLLLLKKTTIEYTKKPKTDYFSTIHKSLQYPVDTVELLKLPYVFAQAYEQVSARILHMIWRHGDLYSKIITIMGGFDQVRIFLFVRVLFKRYNCLVSQDWFVDSGTIVAGSVSQAFEGRHYYRSMRLEVDDALVQRRVEGYK